MSAQQHLDALFAADAEADAAERRFLSEGTDGDRVAAVLQAVDAALESDGPTHRSRLTRLADLCAQIPGQETADKLVDILDSPDPLVQDVGGRAMIERAYARYAEVAHAIDQALGGAREGASMELLPFVLAEVGEPSAIGFLKRFLVHPNPDVVASAIEAAAELGDPELVPALRPLVDDGRRVSLDDDEGEGTTTTLGELASETLDELDGDDD